MSQQLDLIDTLERVTDHSVHMAGAFASPDWYSEAEAALSLLIRRGEDFSTDDLWRLLEHTGLTTPEPRAMGAIIRQASKDGRITATGQYIKSLRRDCHRRPLAVWRPARQRA